MMASRRAGKLYLPLGGRHFRCRRCYDLAYHSQWEEPWWRAKRRARKLWRKLGGDPDDDFIPPRPRVMHRRTYERLIAAAERAEDLARASIHRGFDVEALWTKARMTSRPRMPLRRWAAVRRMAKPVSTT